ncbi:MAG: signal peptidase I [Leptospiraceae bacterium]|nr:signal peptidase I [Leptospiraceae bacterium]
MSKSNKKPVSQQPNSPLDAAQAAAPAAESGLSFVRSLFSLLVLVGLVLTFKNVILDANNIPSASMVPTLKIGDYLFVNKMRYSLLFPFLGAGIANYDNPERGDIVTFQPPNEEGKNWVKRLIGLPGDVFRIRQISACDLSRTLRSRSTRPDGNVPAPLPPDKRDYRCPEEGASLYEPPTVTIFEYRAAGSGEWINFGPREIPAAEARQILIDADEVGGVLHPDLIPAAINIYHPLPVLFEEVIGGTRHLFLETPTDPGFQKLLGPDCTAEQMQSTGCQIPADHYLVMGDNRDNSQDSRFVGYIERSMFRGKALVTYFSINWYQKICETYAGNIPYDQRDGSIGFDLPDFSYADQARYCHLVGENGDYGLLAWLVNFLSNEIPRMDVRWSRIGLLLQ